jgi:hypothetical protein
MPGTILTTEELMGTPPGPIPANKDLAVSGIDTFSTIYARTLKLEGGLLKTPMTVIARLRACLLLP